MGKDAMEHAAADSPAKEHDGLLSADTATNALAVAIAPYGGEAELAQVMALVDRELSEPYTIFTYRYFIQQWPQLCFVAHTVGPSGVGGGGVQQDSDVAVSASTCDAENGQSDSLGAPRALVGVVICKLDRHLKGQRLLRGYIGMLSVERTYRGHRIATRLLKRALATMVEQGAQEIVLETEADNVAALRLYESLGFIRTKRLFHYYLNGKDSFRLVLVIPEEYWQPARDQADGQAMAEQDDGRGREWRQDIHDIPPYEGMSSMQIA